MTENDQTTRIQAWIDRLNEGDDSARDELIRVARCRLYEITSRTLKREFALVRKWEETDDICQDATLRLCEALKEVKLASARDFFQFSAVQVRRVLLDLARRYSYKGARGRVRGLDGPRDDEVHGVSAIDPAEETNDPLRLAIWTEFHEKVDSLPDDLREIFNLLYYHNFTQPEAARILDVSERTVKRRWQQARMSLAGALGRDSFGA
jgi:RNA polymerase sigma factor (sigma-70 family)